MPRSRRSVPALIDVARKAGVGAGTVSRVINGGHNVSAKTLAVVRAAIQELGYVPSHAARTLKGARTKTIGLIVPSVANPFFSSAADAIQKVASAHGCLVLLAASENDPSKEKELVTTFIQRRIDGLIFVPSDAAHVDILENAGFPAVCFDQPINGGSIATVLADNYGGARIATEHLVAHGYKRILCIGEDPKLFTSQERFRAHRDVISAAGLPYLFEPNVRDFASAEAAVIAHLNCPKPIDAVFSTKNSTTLYVYYILRKLGCRIPDSVALIGYDDFQLADALEPAISVIRQPVQEIATRAAKMLFQQMGRVNRHQDSVIVNVQLITRASCGALGTC
jgi:LacI family transcriptional regulator